MVPFLAFWVAYFLASNASEEELKAKVKVYEEAKTSYCLSEDNSWVTIDAFLSCHAAVAHVDEEVLLKCKQTSFNSSAEAKQSFCSHETGVQSLGEFNECVVKDMMEKDPDFNMDKILKKDAKRIPLMTELYDCLLKALTSGDNSTENYGSVTSSYIKPNDSLNETDAVDD